jgi:hypothetical protein
MWRITDRHFSLLTGGEGERFADFMNSLLRAQCLVCGLSDAQIHTCLPQNIRDRGVDDQIDAASYQDDTGWLGVPTTWQFKATADLSEAALREEIRKPWAAELVSRGYGYRLAACASLTPEKEAGWQDLLTAEAKNILKGAQACGVLAASDLAAWASRFAGLSRFFDGARGQVLYWDTWKHNATSTTPHYVPVDAWQPQHQELAFHADLANPVGRPLLTIQGVAGVGKTRLVFEALAGLPSAPDLVRYTDDGEAALSVAYELANEPQARAVLIADECPLRGA